MKTMLFAISLIALLSLVAPTASAGPLDVPTPDECFPSIPADDFATCYAGAAVTYVLFDVGFWACIAFLGEDDCELPVA